MTVWAESRPSSFAFLTVLWTKHYVSITETNVKLQSSMETIIMPSLKDLTLMISGKNLTLKFLPRAVSCMHTRSLHRFTCCCFFLMQVKKQNQHWQQMQRYSKTTEKSQNLKISLVAKVSAVHRTLARQNSNTEESGQYDSNTPPTNTLNLITGSGVGVGWGLWFYSCFTHCLRVQQKWLTGHQHHSGESCTEHAQRSSPGRWRLETESSGGVQGLELSPLAPPVQLCCCPIASPPEGSRCRILFSGVVLDPNIWIKNTI